MKTIVDQPRATDEDARAAGRVIASFRTYGEAEAAVERLSDCGVELL